MKYTTLQRIFTFLLALSAFSPQLMAQNQSQARTWSLDITPQVGYRTSMTFNTEPPVDGVNARIVLDANPSFGVAFGARFADQNVVEFRWAREDTEMRVTGPAVLARQRVLLDQFHFDFTHEYVVREWPAWARPFIMGGVGWTRISSTEATNTFTRFSFGLGGGIKAFPSPHLGFKLQAQWLPMWVTPEVQAFCRVGCVVHLTGQLVSQGEVAIGPVIRF
jgi:hypothetical protein